MNKKTLLSLLILFALSSCTRSLEKKTPIPSSTVTPTLSLAAHEGTAVPLPLPSFTPITAPTFSGSTGTYAVILVAEGEELNIHSTPGVENPVLGTLQHSQSGVTVTGKNVSIGEDVWVEIHKPGGGTGWVDSEFLTEYVTSASFCMDARVVTLLRNLELAVNTQDGELLKKLVSPAHGLDVVYIRDEMIGNYSPDEASWAFLSTYLVEWGLGAGSGEPVSGTFSEKILPALQEVFKNLHTACNEVKLGGATYLVDWPKRYSNVNFYSMHNPGNDPSFGGLDWRTWLVGVEYVDGQPFLFALLHYKWEP